MFKETKLNYLFGRNQALSTVWTVWHTICQGFAIISQHLIKSAFTYWQHVAKPLILTWLCGGGSQFGQSLSIWCCTPRVWCQSMIYVFVYCESFLFSKPSLDLMRWREACQKWCYAKSQESGLDWIGINMIWFNRNGLIMAYEQ